MDSRCIDRVLSLRRAYIYNRSEVSSVCSFMVRLLLDSCVDPSSETYFTANKEEMNTGKK